ncbi:MAG TPA: MBL fold metallo-hydrolase [Candidatus Sulfotelmatobacter sp.]|nr:MBL fold metallo-hydrolase [Candidatus Sulfotelmatobacter sp.]
MRLQFVGSGDAFGSGGRFNTCFHVTADATRFLIDCGASSMVALRRCGLDLNAIETVFVSHLHGDHFGGLPFFIVDAQLVSKRTAPLTIAGPPGLRQRLADAMENFLPGSTKVTRKFAVDIVELEPDRPATVNGVAVTPFLVQHVCGAPPFALRLAVDGKVVAYTGDTEWTDALVPAGRDADLFVAEAYFYDKPIKYHLDVKTLLAHVGEIRPKRLILTHMSPDMLARPAPEGCTKADDGMIVEF